MMRCLDSVHSNTSRATNQSRTMGQLGHMSSIKEPVGGSANATKNEVIHLNDLHRGTRFIVILSYSITCREAC